MKRTEDFMRRLGEIRDRAYPNTCKGKEDDSLYTKQRRRQRRTIY